MYKSLLDFFAEDYAKKIEDAYKRYNINTCIKALEVRGGKSIYSVELKKATLEKSLRARASDVQQRLHLSGFWVKRKDSDIVIIVSFEKIVYPHLPNILSMQEFEENSRNMSLPYVVGYDDFDELVTVDLALLPHLLVAGASNSGKTVGLRNLIISVMYRTSPQFVNFILIDAGASDLTVFNEIPHLSCSVVDNRRYACHVLCLLSEEMERRIKLKTANNGQFAHLPRLVLVIDEFSALFSDRQTDRRIINAVSSLLRRGRHAKIHVVLAAQNPTIQNMKVDLGNITARIAFRCAKKNFSETIIGEGGAENLSGAGDMYFKYPQYDGIRRIQGAYVSAVELSDMLRMIKAGWEQEQYDVGRMFTINETDLQQDQIDIVYRPTRSSLSEKSDRNNRMLARILLWTLEQDTISCNSLMQEFGIGWRRADNFMNHLHDWGIVEDLEAKLPRKVLVQSASDLPEELRNFLSRIDFQRERS